MSKPSLCVIGAAGRMGRRIVAAAAAEEITVSAAVEREGAPELGQDAGLLAGVGPLGIPISAELGKALARSSVAIDFTSATATEGNLAACEEARIPLILGTTGLPEAARQRLAKATKTIPVVHAPNFSLGVNALLAVVAGLARTLPGYDVEVVEIHHRKKTDAPSGTALALAGAAASARGQELSGVEVTGRQGAVGARTETEVGVLAVRGGDVVGDHTVYFLGPGERIELTHRAHSRDTFAAGAVRAARWVMGQKPGLYDMRHVLGLPLA